MSHFTVLVAARNREELEALLLPYHEYECTGIEQYLEWEDVTDDAQAKFTNSKESFVRLPGGEIKDEHDAQFYHQEPDEGGFPLIRTKFTLPEGAETVEMTRAEAGLETFEEFLEDYYGARPIPGKPGRWGRLTNPNARWDWWEVGGRWTGMLKLKSARRLLLRGAVEVAGFHRNEVDTLVNLYLTKPQKFEDVIAKYEGRVEEIRTVVKQLAEGAEEVFVRPESAENGRPGLMTEPNSDPERADSALVGDVDWDAILGAQIENRMKEYGDYRAALAESGSPEPDARWEKNEHARAAFKSAEDMGRSTAAIGILHRRHNFIDGTWQEIADMFYKDEAEYRALFKGRALTWAFIDGDGRWVERAKMGWWATHGDVDGDYDAAFWKFVRSLDPKNDRVWVVDCHI